MNARQGGGPTAFFGETLNTWCNEVSVKAKPEIASLTFHTSGNGGGGGAGAASGRKLLESKRGVGEEKLLSCYLKWCPLSVYNAVVLGKM